LLYTLFVSFFFERRERKKKGKERKEREVFGISHKDSYKRGFG
jgi:hypothetical protein